MRSLSCFLSLLVLAASFARAEDAAKPLTLTVPAATAYLSPDPEGARVNEAGIRRWRDPANHVLWFGEFKTPGKLTAAVSLRLPEGTTRKYRLQLGHQQHEAEASGAADKTVTATFGEYDVPEAGYQKFELTSLATEAGPQGEIEALQLSGPALADAHFNLDPRRNAASVHLAYPTPKDAKIEWFYNEVTAVDDPVTTFYMACGFHRGYFGMQVNSPTERRIIFSVWDAGTGKSADDRSTVAKENFVSLVAKGEDVHTSVFGNEGTGGHSHLKYLWKTGEPQRFLLTAQPTEDTATIYSGYYFHPEKQEWMLISSMKAPKDGSYLRGLHSFSENFSGSTGHIRRKALYGPQWIRTADGTWTELTRATFSHDPTGKANRLDRFMGVEEGKFFLSHGGFVPGSVKFGAPFDRPATEKPLTITLPAIEALATPSEK